MKNFLDALGTVHREAFLFMLACPLLAAIPVAVEFAQHVIELRAGMYVDEAGALAAESDPLRMQFGFLKVLALALPAYWIPRFMHGARDADAARTWDTKAVWLYSGVFLFMAVNAALSLFVLPTTPNWMIGTMAGGMILSVLLARWQAAAPLGQFINPLRSAIEMLRNLPWALAFSLVAMLPVMALHYALAIVAILAAPDWLDWVLMVVDSVVVGWLAGILAAANYVAALRAGPLLAPSGDSQTA